MKPPSTFHAAGSPVFTLTQPAMSFPLKSTAASEGGAPTAAPGCTIGGCGRVLSCTRHFEPGMNGVSV